MGPAKPPAAPPDLTDLAGRVAANRADARRRAAVRRQRRQILPSVGAGSAALATLGLTVAWVSARMPPAASVPPSAVSPATAAADAHVAALQHQLAAEEQTLGALSARAVAAQRSAGGTPSHGSTAVPVIRLPSLPQAATAAAPATHATTGASHGH